ncbi:MAG: putative epoxidase LasC [Chroococcidiopsis sp. SAG 2025]|nr:monooxygenase [Chroococcidiopsis sp. SAG 2025]MDV2995763.1 putative epoxidase LasC [Chroococcidiopsis sp. SAG 2025]
MMNSTRRHGQDRAVVIGGSIAGMLAARVLADDFATVAIADTDMLPSQPQARKGVPQSVQPHVLFAKGYRILEELFPGIGAELSAAGALSIDWLREFHHFSYGNWSANTTSASEIISCTCSRPLLEWAIRRRILEIPNIEIIAKHRATGLVRDSHGDRVTGIHLRPVGEGTESELFATLIVDASGRRSQAPQWLESAGFTPPPETVVNPFLGYATRRYRAPAGFDADWKIMLISQSPPDNTRLGYLARIEGGEWIATLGGYNKDFPPLDDEGFLAFARSLPSQRFYEAIASADPVSPTYAHRATANRLYHYEKIKLPQGFIALGDAVCALCPIYGQGMTVSAVGAIALRDWLKQGHGSHVSALDLDTSDFQKRLAKQNSLAWTIATTQDLGFPKTKQHPTNNSNRSSSGKLGKFMRWYNRQLMKGTSSRPELHALVLEVGQMLKSPLAFYHPKTIWRILTVIREQGAGSSE